MTKLEFLIPDIVVPFELTSGGFTIKLTKDIPEIVPPVDIIPPARRVDWAAVSGIPGGIPHRTKIFRTIPAGASLTEVQAALNACPSEQVVQMSDGRYQFDGHVDLSSIKEAVTWRGGENTKLSFSAGSILMRRFFSEPALSVDVPLRAGAAKGATTIELATVPEWVRVGHIYLLDQLNDPTLVRSTGHEPGSSYRQQQGNGDRGLGQTIKVTSKTSTTVTFETPLYMDYPIINQPELAQSGYNATLYSSPLRGCGVEDMEIDFSYANGRAHSVQMLNCDGCWIKNVTSKNTPGGCHVWPVFSYRCEIRDSRFEGSHLLDSGQGYGIALYHSSCGFRVENNVLRDLHVGLQASYGSGGNVFGYNRVLGGQAESGQAPALNTHGCHAHMNLFEGNDCDGKVLGDFTHGSSSHITLFRNRIRGRQTSLEGVNGQEVILIQGYNRKWNIVGNVLGDSGFHTVYEVAPWAAPSSGARPIYKLGYWGGDFAEFDSQEVLDLLRHSNYDVVRGLDPNSRPLPASLYLDSKPAWLDGNWPLFDPLKP